MANTFSVKIMYSSYNLVKDYLKHGPIDLWFIIDEVFQAPRVKLHQNIILSLVNFLRSIDCYKFDYEIIFDDFAYPFLSTLMLFIALDFFEGIMFAILEMPDFVNNRKYANVYGVVDFQRFSDVWSVILLSLRFVSFVRLLNHFIEL